MSRNSSLGVKSRKTNCRGKMRRQRPPLGTILWQQRQRQARLTAARERRKAHALAEIRHREQQDKQEFCEGAAQAADDAEVFSAPPSYPDKSQSWWKGYLMRFNYSRKQPA